MKASEKKAVLLAMLMLGGCAGGQDLFGDPKAGYVANPSTLTKSADWARAQTVTVRLSEYAFSPTSLTFSKGTPYRLKIVNGGSATHFFVSQGFFKAIAARGLRTASGETTHPYVKSIAVGPGESKVLTFVPIKAGGYTLDCTAPFHASLGMTGAIRIQ